jgi:hypothetical protein
MCEGFLEHKFKVGKYTWNLVDAGGQRAERRKWVRYYEGVVGVIFVAALDDWDVPCSEEPNKTRLQESLEVFESMINHEWFSQVPWILFLNKTDLFTEKIKSVPLSNTFKDYTGWSSIYLSHSLTLVHSFSQSFTLIFIHSLTLSLSPSFTLSPFHSLLYSFSHSLTLSFIHSLTLSLSHPFTLIFIHSLTLSLSSSFILSLFHSLLYSFSHSLTLVHSFSHSFTLTFIHSLTLLHSFSHSLMLNTV